MTYDGPSSIRNALTPLHRAHPRTPCHLRLLYPVVLRARCRRFRGGHTCAERVQPAQVVRGRQEVLPRLFRPRCVVRVRCRQSFHPHRDQRHRARCRASHPRPLRALRLISLQSLLPSSSAPSSSCVCSMCRTIGCGRLCSSCLYGSRGSPLRLPPRHGHVAGRVCLTRVSCRACLGYRTWFARERERCKPTRPPCGFSTARRNAATRGRDIWDAQLVFSNVWPVALADTTLLDRPVNADAGVGE